MNSKWKIVFAVCAFLLLGVSILAVQSARNAVRLGQEAAAARAETAALRQQLREPAAAQPEFSSGLDADVWRSRVGRLESQLAEKDRLIAALRKPDETPPEPTGMPPPGPPPGEDRRPGRDRGAWLEEIKQTDPRRYEEIQARRQEARERRQRSIAEQATYFLNRDVAKMDENEIAEYKRMLGLLDETWRLSEQMQAELSPEERHDLMRTMRDNMQELTPLMETERDRTFYEIGRDFGYTESEAQDFAEYLNGIIEVTSMRTLFGGMRGGDRVGPPDGGGVPGAPRP